MALYAIGDLHLCLGAPKPMDIFGGAWVGYMDKLKEGMAAIGPEDTTVLLGDLRWQLSARIFRRTSADAGSTDSDAGKWHFRKGIKLY